eukprot:CAMPEP_0176045402 /NCGR_PEP_ID=MMETSP0120_2-20121206/22536_1 /TAXON_ID=160619 /ORGANISM="Kryptoperidinium foliaceum, Strain CCMP 1326" /LENGTH=241 /DNA_ID=CAMNT_0017378805 /DNA_START=52 /DNA_END=777 /DNA_ORIENTATION=+
MMRTSVVVVAALASCASGRFLSAPKVVNASAVAKAAPATANSTKAAAAPKHLTESEQLEKLAVGLKVVQNLRSQFTAATSEEQDDGSKFANGALSEELGKKDSKVWAALQDMLAKTVTTMGQLKGKSKSDRAKIMDSLGKDLDSKAGEMMKLTNDVTLKQYNQDEEYLLGLLNQHREWSFDKQLNATATFNKGSPVIAELYKHHDSKTPLAAQLANLMDAAHSAKKAARAFLQLVASVRSA